ncbi:hypothetical protein [Ideonella livida]|uniref:LicD family protein n=1 Tax=Ideonella livida TaxID=2707176 RepID=A0A7C9PGC7_9BURK|nr:hypothetical protein [Ideonella livida]NDY90969.1 hypothetical protein [Ideonella livida]
MPADKESGGWKGALRQVVRSGRKADPVSAPVAAPAAVPPPQAVPAPPDPDLTLDAWVQALLQAARPGRQMVDSFQRGGVIPLHRHIQRLRIRGSQKAAMRIEDLCLLGRECARQLSWGTRVKRLAAQAHWTAVTVDDIANTPLEITLEEPGHVDQLVLRLAQRQYRQRAAHYGMSVEVQELDGRWVSVFAPAQPAQSARRLLAARREAASDDATRRAIDFHLLRLGAAYLDDIEGLQALMEQVRAQLAQDSAGFKVLYRELLEWAYPLSLANHGLHQRLGTRDETEVLQAVAEVARKVATLGWPVIVNSGTLLGLVREGRLLAHDDDIDLAVLLPAGSAAEVRRRRAEFTQALESAGLSISERPAHWKVMRLGIPFDIFPGWVDQAGQVHIYPYCGGQLPATALLPLVEREFRGVALPLPAQPEALLAVNYGEGWRQPDPTFRFDWAASRRTFKDLLTGPKA